MVEGVLLTSDNTMKSKFFLIWLSIASSLRATWTSRIIVAAYCSSVEDEEPSSFGQSFIGQDVCGSKYNDDPFDAAEGKGNAWQDFQRRVREKEAAELAAATNITKVDALRLIQLREKQAPGKWP